MFLFLQKILVERLIASGGILIPKTTLCIPKTQQVGLTSDVVFVRTNKNEKPGVRNKKRSFNGWGCENLAI